MNRVSLKKHATVAAGWSMVGITLIAPFLITSALYEFADLPKRWGLQAGVLIALICWFPSRRARLRWPVGGWAMIGFLAWSGLSLFWSKNAYYGYLIWSHWAFCVLGYFLITQFSGDGAFRGRWLAVVSIGAIGVSLIGLLQKYYGLDYFPQSARPGATFGHKNMASQFVVFALPLILYRTGWSGGRLSAAMWALGIIVTIQFLVMAGSLAAFVSLSAVSIGVVAFYGWKRKDDIWPSPSNRAIVVMSLLFSAVLVNYSPSGWHWIGERFKAEAEAVEDGLVRDSAQFAQAPGESRNIGERRKVYQVAAKMGWQHLIHGVGLGGFAQDYPRSNAGLKDPIRLRLDEEWRNAHCDLLQIWGELGLPGILAILAFLYSLCCTASRKFRRDGVKVRPIDLWMGAALTALIINSLFSYPVYNAIPPFLLLLCLGFLFQEEGFERRLSGVFPIARLLATVLIVASGLHGWMVWRSARFELAYARYLRAKGAAEMEEIRHWRSSLEALSWGRPVFQVDRVNDRLLAGDPVTALEISGMALEQYPFSPRLWFLRGSSEEQLGLVEDAALSISKVGGLVWDARVEFLAARIERARGRYAETIAHLDSAAALSKDPIRYWDLAAATAEEMNDYRLADQYYEKILTLSPGRAITLKRQGLLWIHHLNRRDEGDTLLREIIEAIPDWRNDPEIVEALKL